MTCTCKQIRTHPLTERVYVSVYKFTILWTTLQLYDK